MKKILILEISGMHCRSCEEVIEQELRHLGVEGEIQIDHKNGNAKIEINESFSFSEKDVLAAIKGLGYQANLLRVKTVGE